MSAGSYASPGCRTQQLLAGLAFRRGKHGDNHHSLFGLCEKNRDHPGQDASRREHQMVGQAFLDDLWAHESGYYYRRRPGRRTVPVEPAIHSGGLCWGGISFISLPT